MYVIITNQNPWFLILFIIALIAFIMQRIANYKLKKLARINGHNQVSILSNENRYLKLHNRELTEKNIKLRTSFKAAQHNLKNNIIKIPPTQELT